ncbi:HNH endonuclease [Leptothoe spongobia]|uniref:HNH endonuclease n=1 Tax=Leptothoe spongobia TAU-MAC 1115 TaxID=1967444 RepID=A0A947DBJ5_9CYAN|nr:HNH endonuclease [Leptothoe spongobia]MBT9314210.1 HNH endonuclease [Leptothoe spongobia TAU-MAC 1115]
MLAEYGRIRRQPKEELADFVVRIEGQNNQFLDWVNQTAISNIDEHPQRFTLTVAHLDHRPENCKRSNLKALCAPCHCRYDLQPSSMFIKQQLKLERQGQLRLEVA